MNEELLNSGTTGMTVNESMKADLFTAARWTYFLCVLGCIGIGFMVLVAILMFALGNFAGRIFSGMETGGVFLGILYLVVAVFYIYPIIKGFQFANGTKAACLTDNEYELARGFAGLRDLFRFMGILAIVCIVIYVLIFFGMFIVGLTAL